MIKGQNEKNIKKLKKSSVVVCKNPKTDKFLAINETYDRGWGTPKGTCDKKESFE